MLSAQTSLTPSDRASEAGGALLVVVDQAPRDVARGFASSLQARTSGGIDGRAVTVLVATSSPDVALVDPADPRADSLAPATAGVHGGGFAGRRSALGALLREADSTGAAAAVLVTAGVRDEAVDWLRLLVSPILEDGFELVCPAYRRARLDGLLGTAILNPLTRALYGARLRQPAGGEVAVSLALARHLLSDLDWRRDPEHAGSDAWLIGKVLAERRRVCQAWLGRWPGDGAAEDASHALSRVVGPVFHEMERRSDRWQRVDGSQPVPAFGEVGAAPDGPARVDVSALANHFRLGLRELDGIWGLVLPPATRLALRRAAEAPAETLRVDDALWARIVYDFAIAYSTRTLERGQLLRSMTPLYVGWLAGFVNDVRELEDTGAEARFETLCAAFEREKPYLIRRWRWPNSFNP